jgi:hypothetical protein
LFISMMAASLLSPASRPRAAHAEPEDGRRSGDAGDDGGGDGGSEDAEPSAAVGDESWFSARLSCPYD